MEAPLQKTNNYLLFAILICVVLYFGQPILIPLSFGALFAMLMAPLCRHLDKKMSRGLSSFLCMMIVMVSLLIILGVAAWQVASFADDMPAIKERTERFITTAQQFIHDTFGVTPEKQKAFAQKQMKTAGESAGAYAGQLLGSIFSAAGWLVLSLIFTFLFLYNKERYENFFVRIFKNDEPAHVKSIVKKITQVSEQYLLGRTYSIIIMFILYSIGLLLIGIKNALLLAAIASLLTFIPYVGTIIGSVFPVIMALITEDSSTPAIWTGVVMVVIQAFDNYFVEPYVVGGEVNLSAFATIFIIICGGLVWGIPGTILFIPLLAIVKIICDNVESLKPYGYLIGDPDGNKPSKIKLWIMEKFGKGKSNGNK